MGELDKPLEEWVGGEVRRRWAEENSAYLVSQGFEADILDHPEKMPRLPVGESLIPAIQYDSSFPSKVIPLILQAATNRQQAQEVIDKVFGDIIRTDSEQLDGYHSHSQVVGTVYEINTHEALNYLSRDLAEKL